MRSLFDNGIQARAGGPFLGLNLPKLLQDLQPVYQASRNLVKDQATTPTTVLPTAQPGIRPPAPPVDNTSTYLWLSVLALGGAGAAWYFFRKKKPAAGKK